MPKRIIDGERMHNSDKIAALPAWAKAEFSWILPLALANGVFECEPRGVWARAYSYARPEITIDQVYQLLAAFERVKLLFRWREPDGKEWGYWVGIDKEGRLPPPTQRERMAKGPNPPEQEFREFLSPRPVLGDVQQGLVGVGLVGKGLVGKTAAAAAGFPPDPPDVKNLLRIYEQERGEKLPSVREMSPQRLSKSRQRVLNHKADQETFLADFEKAVRKASVLAWPSWKPNFDWFVANDTNYLKVLEGNYDHWGNGQKGAPKHDAQRNAIELARQRLNPGGAGKAPDAPQGNS